MLKAAMLEPNKYGLDSGVKDKLKRMEKLIGPIEQKVIEANMFKVIVRQRTLFLRNTKFVSIKIYFNVFFFG